MTLHNTSYFKATALDDTMLRRQAPSIFATGPMSGLSYRYAFVPTIRIVEGLREHNWAPVAAEEQRIRKETRRGFQKHMLRFRRIEQMMTLDEWNVELVLVNSHDAGCAYQIHAGIYRRICSNGLVLSQDSFEALRFRHTGLLADDVIQASFRLLDQIPRVGALVERFRQRELADHEATALATRALRLRYGDLALAPVDPATLLQTRRPQDEGADRHPTWVFAWVRSSYPPVWPISRPVCPAGGQQTATGTSSPPYAHFSRADAPKPNSHSNQGP